MAFPSYGMGGENTEVRPKALFVVVAQAELLLALLL